MKKRMFGIMLAVSVAAALTGCGKQKTTGFKTDITAQEYADSIKANAEIYKNHVTLPEYKGIEVEVDRSVQEVSDEEIDTYISNVLSGFATTEKVTEGVTAVGDSIVLDYKGLLDGEAFSGGTATDATYTVGSGGFIKDLDEGLAGLTLGQEYEIPCRFDDSYSNSDLAGKDVIFVVTVTAIQKQILPELTDEWVAENAEAMGVEASTVDELKKETRASLEETAEANFASTKYQLIYDKLDEMVTVETYPQEEMDSLVSTVKTNMESEYDQMGTYYGYSDKWAYFSARYGVADDDALTEYATENAQTYLKEKMILTLIAVENDITVEADEINEMGEELASYYGYENYQEILDQYGNTMNAEIGYELLYEKMIEFLNEQAVEA